MSVWINGTVIVQDLSRQGPADLECLHPLFMALWEYKVITSGKGGFATPALLETYLNQLGTDEWEIIEFRTQPDNPLAFSGLARRTTQRDWTLEAAAAAAARAEADKLRAEFAAKFQAATTGAAADAVAAASESGTPDRDDTFRRPRDTEHDDDPYALDDSSSDDGSDEWPEEDQLPTFFEAIRPHMRRNQKGPGYSVGVDYLVKKFDVLEEDLMTALKECGFEIPEDEDDKPVYVEYDGDLYWVNTNRRGELWINTREKPRPAFKVVKGTRLEGAEVPEPQGGRRQDHERSRKSEGEHRKQAHEVQPDAPKQSEGPQEGQRVEAQAQPAKATAPAEAGPAEPLPEGTALLEKLRPLMRRSRGGWSGTIGYLSRALRHTDAELLQALAGLGLAPGSGSEKAPVVEVESFAYWLNRDGRGGVWINVRDAKRMRAQDRPEGDKAPEGEASAAPTPEAPAEAAPSAELPAAIPAAVEVPSTPAEAWPEATVSTPVGEPSTESVAVSAPSDAGSASPLAGARLLLKPTRTGAFAGELCSLASKIGKSAEEFLAVLVESGLRVPEKPREKPVFVEYASEIFWLNRNSKGELWLNAKASKFTSDSDDASETGEAPSDDSSEKKPRGRGPRTRRRASDTAE